MFKLKPFFSCLPMARSTRAYEFGLALLDDLPPQPRLLEIGAGLGYSAAWLSRRCLKREALTFGPRRPDFIQATAPALPLAAASFDAVLLVMTFQQQVLREAARVLPPGKENGFMMWLTARKPFDSPTPL